MIERKQEAALQFFTPVYEQILNPRFKLHEEDMWQWINSPNRVRQFFLSQELLLKTWPKVCGCYKVTITQTELQKNPNFNADYNLLKKPINLWLHFESNQIESYVTKDKTEYQNPFFLTHQYPHEIGIKF